MLNHHKKYFEPAFAASERRLVFETPKAAPEKKYEKQEAIDIVKKESDKRVGLVMHKLDQVGGNFKSDLYVKLYEYYQSSAERAAKEGKLDEKAFAKYKEDVLKRTDEILKQYLPSQEEIDAKKNLPQAAKETVGESAELIQEEIPDEIPEDTPAEKIQEKLKDYGILSSAFNKEAEVKLNDIQGFFKKIEVLEKAKEGFTKRVAHIWYRAQVWHDTDYDKAVAGLRTQLEKLKSTVNNKKAELAAKKVQLEKYGKSIGRALEKKKGDLIKSRDGEVKKIEEQKTKQGKDIETKEQKYKELKEQEKALLVKREQLSKSKENLEKLSHEDDSPQKMAAKLQEKQNGVERVFQAESQKEKFLTGLLEDPELNDEQKKQVEAALEEVRGRKQKATDGKSYLEKGVQKSKGAKVTMTEAENALEKNLSSVDSTLTSFVEPTMKSIDESLVLMRSYKEKYADCAEGVKDKYAEGIEGVDKIHEQVDNFVLDTTLSNSLSLQVLNKSSEQLDQIKVVKDGFFGAVWDGGKGLYQGTVGVPVGYLADGISAVGHWMSDQGNYLSDSAKSIESSWKYPAMAGAEVTSFFTGATGGAVELVGGVLKVLSKPYDTVEGLASLVTINAKTGEVGDTALAGKSWKELGKALISYEEFEKGHVGTGTGKIFTNIASLFVTGGAGSAGEAAAAASKLARAEKLLAAGERAGMFTGRIAEASTFFRVLGKEAVTFRAAGSITKSAHEAANVLGGTGPMSALARSFLHRLPGWREAGLRYAMAEGARAKVMAVARGVLGIGGKTAVEGVKLTYQGAKLLMWELPVGLIRGGARILKALPELGKLAAREALLGEGAAKLAFDFNRVGRALNIFEKEGSQIGNLREVFEGQVIGKAEVVEDILKSIRTDKTFGSRFKDVKWDEVAELIQADPSLASLRQVNPELHKLFETRALGKLRAIDKLSAESLVRLQEAAETIFRWSEKDDRVARILDQMFDKGLYPKAAKVGRVKRAKAAEVAAPVTPVAEVVNPVEAAAGAAEKSSAYRLGRYMRGRMGEARGLFERNKVAPTKTLKAQLSKILKEQSALITNILKVRLKMDQPIEKQIQQIENAITQIEGMESLPPKIVIPEDVQALLNPPKESKKGGEAAPTNITQEKWDQAPLVEGRFKKPDLIVSANVPKAVPRDDTGNNVGGIPGGTPVTIVDVNAKARQVDDTTYVKVQYTDNPETKHTTDVWVDESQLEQAGTEPAGMTSAAPETAAGDKTVREVKSESGGDRYKDEWEKATLVDGRFKDANLLVSSRIEGGAIMRDDTGTIVGNVPAGKEVTLVDVKAKGRQIGDQISGIVFIKVRYMDGETAKDVWVDESQLELANPPTGPKAELTPEQVELKKFLSENNLVETRDATSGKIFYTLDKPTGKKLNDQSPIRSSGNYDVDRLFLAKYVSMKLTDVQLSELDTLYKKAVEKSSLEFDTQPTLQEVKDAYAKKFLPLWEYLGKNGKLPEDVSSGGALSAVEKSGEAINMAANAPVLRPHPDLKNLVPGPLYLSYLEVLNTVAENKDSPDGATFVLKFNGNDVPCRLLPEQGMYVLHFTAGEKRYRSLKDFMEDLNSGNLHRFWMNSMLMDEKAYKPYKEKVGVVDTLMLRKKMGDVHLEFDWNRPDPDIYVSALPHGKVAYEVHRENVGVYGSDVRSGVAENFTDFMVHMQHIRQWAEAPEHLKVQTVEATREILWASISNPTSFALQEKRIGRTLDFKVLENEVAQLHLDWGGGNDAGHPANVLLKVWSEDDSALHFTVKGHGVDAGPEKATDFADLMSKVEGYRKKESS